MTTRKAESARRANDALVNKIAFQGDVEHGILGIFKHPNITKYVLPADGEGSATTWDKKTPVQILRDMNNAVSMIVDVTKGVEIPDTILLPIDKYNIIATTLLPDSGGQTILSFFQEKNPYIQTIKSIHEASGAGTGGKDIMFIYRNDANALSLKFRCLLSSLPLKGKIWKWWSLVILPLPVLWYIILCLSAWQKVSKLNSSPILRRAIFYI